MLCTYIQTFSLSQPKKNRVGGHFLQPKRTARSIQVTFEHIRPIYQKGYRKKAC